MCRDIASEKCGQNGAEINHKQKKDWFYFIRWQATKCCGLTSCQSGIFSVHI